MAAPESLTPSALWNQLRPDWLIEPESNRKAEKTEGARTWPAVVEHRRTQLKAITQNKGIPTPPLVLIAESDPVDFLASFLAALLEGWNLALANPDWGTQEWNAVSQLLSPDFIWGKTVPRQVAIAQNPQPILPSFCEPILLIPTGGSSGQVKFACHRWSSLMASVSGFLQYFSPHGEPIYTYCVLPLHHVSGLMQILRAWVSGGQVTLTPFQTLKKNLSSSSPLPLSLPHLHPSLPFPSIPSALPFLSLVPTQLKHLLQANQAPWLRQFHAVLLGGAPPWPTLLAHAAAQQIPLCLSYGMTETAAMVTALSPTDFLQGQRSSGKWLPHATIQIVKANQLLPLGQIGQIVVCSAAVAQGYYGRDLDSVDTAFAPDRFYTDDLGYLSPEGSLHIIGRVSSKIISGGENIFPAEVEAAIHSTGQVKDVCVVGLPHPHWGEAVTAVYVPSSANVCAKTLQQALETSATNKPMLSRYKHPKQWIALTALPRNAQGKLNRQQLLALLAQRIALSSPLAPVSISDDGDFL